MIHIGKFNRLAILRDTSVGLFLGDDNEDVLLPLKYKPQDYEIGDTLEVFVYRDGEGRKVATNLMPKIFLNEFAFLRVSATSDVGAFMDWGMEKDLLVPFREQRQKMEVNRWYIVYLDIDQKTDRLFASNRIERYLNNDDLSIQVNDEVEIMVMSKTDLGYSVIVNSKYKGLVFSSDVFKEINIGDQLTAYVKNIRADNKLDISLQALGYHNFIDENTDLIYQALKMNNGYLAITDKSSPEEIYDHFGMSKKSFKKALGSLYKNKQVSLEEEGIRLI